MLLKYAFNDMRSKRENTDFFDDDILHFLMNESETAPLKNVTVLAGLAVNNSPAPDFMFGNQKLQWCQSPIFLSNSIVDHINYETGQIHIREPREVETFESLATSYLFRFNSVQFIVLCWDKGITDEILERNINFPENELYQKEQAKKSVFFARTAVLLLAERLFPK